MSRPPSSVARLGHRVAPVLELRITGNSSFFLPTSNKKDQAGVVHLVVELSHYFEQPLTGHTEQAIAEPARFFGNRLAALRPRAVFAAAGSPARRL